ncbi:hypothetical protein ABPG72_006524 [Tetrahymena utriculariae]
MEDSDILQEFKSLDDEKYEFSIYCDLVQRFKFDLQTKKVAIARFGGPIAICRDIVQTQFFENNDMFKEDIWFYSNEGLILNKVKFPYNQRIVGFDFIYEERLVVVLENGFYYLINPFEFDQNESKRIEEKRFNKPDEDLIVEAKILENGLGFFTRSNKFYIMNNLNEGKLIDFGNPGISSEISCWSLIPQGIFLDENDVKFNLYVANSAANGGGVLCIESFKWQQKRLDLDQDTVINLKNIKAIAADCKGLRTAYLTQEFDQANKEIWSVHQICEDDYKQVLVQDLGIYYQEELEKIKSQIPYYNKANITTPSTPLSGAGQNQMGNSSRQKLYTAPRVNINIYWIEDKAIVIQIRNTIFLVGSETSAKMEFNNDFESKIPSFVCVQELDGVKILAENRIYMLRNTPQEYLNIFDTTGSYSPGYQLYQKSQINVENQTYDPSQVNQQDDILNNQADLEKAVNDCITAGQYEFNIYRQQKLLKAASHGRILLQGFLLGNKVNNADNEDDDGENQLTKVCKLLRVAYQLNQYQKYKRSITYKQMEYLYETSEVFLKILLRYNYHYIAIEISKFLRLDIQKEIYVHWACCKIEKNEDDSKIINDIKNQFKDQTDIPFSDIIHKALQMGKSKIVLELLNFEPSIQKRIPVLLCMAKTQPNSTEDYFYKALVETLQSKDSNLIYLVIKTIWDKLGEKSFDYFSKEEILSAHFQIFLKTQLDTQKLQQQYVLLYKFLLKQKQFIKAGFSLLEFAIKQNDISKKSELIKQVKAEFQKDLTDKFYTLAIDDQIKFVNYLNSLEEKNIKISIYQQLKQLLAKNQDMAREKLQSEIKLHPKAVGINQLKLLINEAVPREQEIERKVDEINRKTEIIPYSIIIDQLLKNNLEQVAFRIAIKIRDQESKEHQYERIIRQAYQKEKDDLLDSMSYQITRPHIVDLINELREKLKSLKQISQNQISNSSQQIYNMR